MQFQDSILWNTLTGAPLLTEADWALEPPSSKLRRILVISAAWTMWNKNKTGLAQLKTFKAREVLPQRVLARAEDGKGWRVYDAKQQASEWKEADFPAWLRVGNQHFEYIKVSRLLVGCVIHRHRHSGQCRIQQVSMHRAQCVVLRAGE